MRRISDVFDCWFDSGSMPYAQWHYPFENRARFEEHFPADFIVEYISQTRGWFYTLHVLSTALFDRPPFRSCVVHGVILGRDGRKLSKRLRNFPDPEEVFASQGADSMRWYLLSSPVLRGQDVVVDEKGLSEPIRLVLNPIWNSWYFLSLYSNADGLRGRFRTDQRGELDRYVLGKTRRLVEDVTRAMDGNDLAGATSAISGFLDVLTNWYVRRSRGRFWRSGGTARGEPPDGDKVDAYDTLHTVLDVLCRVAAPFLPFLTETVYRGLTGERSVHLQAWPDPDALGLPVDEDLVVAMDLVREVASAGHSIRKGANLRARLPLRSMTVAAPDAARLAPFTALLADELNVKEVRIETEFDDLAEPVLAVVPAVLGPRLGGSTQDVIRAVRAGTWSRTDDGGVVAAGIALEPGEYTLRLRPRDEAASRVLPGDGGVVTLDVETDAELEAEGIARDVVRLVQQARRDAGLDVSDRIVLEVRASANVIDAVASSESYVADQTLAVDLTLEIREIGQSDGERLPSGDHVAIVVKRSDSR
jgi:isoleucyl-tRNA synthetase